MTGGADNPVGRKQPSFGLSARLGLEWAAARSIWRISRRSLAERIYGTGLYRWLLRGPMPDRLLRVPDDLWPGQAARADDMLRGLWAFEGLTASTQSTQPFDMAPLSDAWSDALHGFSWLRDFQALGGDMAEKSVRSLVRDWIARYSEPGGPDAVARIWRAPVLARRLIAWFSHARLVLDSSDLVFRSQVLRTMVRQAAHLQRLMQSPMTGAERLTGGLGLCFAGLVLPQSTQYLTQGLAIVRAEAGRQILSDGGHVSRSPEVLLQVLADLVLLKAALILARAEVPEALQIAIDRATPMLRFLRHGDGQLALFNGTTAIAEGYLDKVIGQADAKGRPLGLAPYMGFGRIQARRSLVIMDMGAPGSKSGSAQRVSLGVEAERAHAGVLSFEFSVGRHRIVTNCGSGRGMGHEWERMARSTAAQSTLALGDQSQFQTLSGRLAMRLGVRAAPMRGAIGAERFEDAHGAVLEGFHDLYASRFGMRHLRRIFLDPEGVDLRGEDSLEPAPREGMFGLKKPPHSLPFIIRFHLHPDVRVSLARDQRSVLLALANGEGWVFRATGAKLELEESVYLVDPQGTRAGVRRSMQIVLTGLTDAGLARIKWAFKRG